MSLDVQATLELTISRVTTLTCNSRVNVTLSITSEVTLLSFSSTYKIVRVTCLVVSNLSINSFVHFGPFGFLGSIGSPGLGVFGSFGLAGSNGFTVTIFSFTVTVKFWSTVVLLSKFLSVAVVNPSLTNSYPSTFKSSSFVVVV